jgi:hypothetical protein
MQDRPLLERVALRYLERLSAAAPVRHDARVHILDAGERAELRRIQRGAVIRSALAGALSSVVAGAAEVYADSRFPAADGAPLGALATYWSFVLGATVVASIFEIGFLYWDALRSVYRLAAAAGLPLKAVEGEGVASALARAALELPNPPDPVLGVDPSREASKLRLVAVALLYKGKIALTSFLLKMLIRRVLTRALARTVLPFVAVPVTAAWNGLVTWLVVREARIRAMGPSAVQEALPELLPSRPASSKEGEVLVRAVASSIVRKQNLHPNLHHLLVTVHQAVGAGEVADVDSPERFIQELRMLPEEARPAALRLLAVAVVIDGRTSARERRLFAQAAQLCGEAPAGGVLDALRGAFLAGDGFPPGLLRSLGARGAPRPGALSA